MKLTTSHLRKIIKEEVQKLMLEWEQAVVLGTDGVTLYQVDDEGNREKLGHIDDFGGEYDYLKNQRKNTKADELWAKLGRGPIGGPRR